MRKEVFYYHGVNILAEDVLTNSGECSGYYETRVCPVAQG
jgi:hypothetical protein